jgi:hypothetical protein
VTVWRAEDIEQLRQLAATGASRVRAAARLRRTQVAIKVKERELGITFKDKKKTRQAFGLDPNWGNNR